ncbi:hypothetical protein Tsubulata_027918 [Turnera subulata]|uniref:Uncharacterized protein n=1 Tax=Turnera subulata TaxID=218843 RepID=A0A9Q0FW46_9ROSI|nr:hypothetical protein Tsubulata_027918 [Turnera subulata]
MAAIFMGSDFAEAYVMKKLHKEKILEKDEEEAAKRGMPSKFYDKKTGSSTSGCFFWASKKSNPAKVSSLVQEPAPNRII